MNDSDCGMISLGIGPFKSEQLKQNLFKNADGMLIVSSRCSDGNLLHKAPYNFDYARLVQGISLSESERLNQN